MKLVEEPKEPEDFSTETSEVLPLERDPFIPKKRVKYRFVPGPFLIFLGKLLYQIFDTIILLAVIFAVAFAINTVRIQECLAIGLALKYLKYWWKK